MINYNGTRFYAVTETGSCSIDFKTWEEKENCGHAHKSLEAAKNCLKKQQRSYCNHGHVAGTPCAKCFGFAQNQSTNADWYNGTIHNQHGEKVCDEEEY